MNTGILYTDGGARGNPGPAGFAAILFDVDGKVLDFTGSYAVHATNNYAEYSALLLGLKMAEKNKIKDLICYLDSELVVKQLNGEYKIKDPNIKKFHIEITKFQLSFKSIEYKHIPRSENALADKLVNLILDIKSL